MFYTGRFNLDGNVCQKIHSEEEYDDDVISNSSIAADIYSDGYVSNEGSVVTIHIKPGYSDKDISFVKEMFHLNITGDSSESNNITEIKIVELEG